MSEQFQFRKAERKRQKARIALDGPAGSGKTYTALIIATTLAERVAVIDTENGSSELYADEFSFDVLPLHPPYSPERYVGAIRAAELEGYDGIVVDSLSHAWSDEGGVLDIVDKESARRKGNKFAAWQVGTPAHNKLINALLRVDAHVVAAMRTKTEWVLQEGPDGKSKPEKIGMAPIQRAGIEYEFTMVGDLDIQHRLIITKTRAKPFADAVIESPGVEFAERIRKWLDSGAAEEDPEAVERLLVQRQIRDRLAEDGLDIKPGSRAKIEALILDREAPLPKLQEAVTFLDEHATKEEAV